MSNQKPRKPQHKVLPDEHGNLTSFRAEEAAPSQPSSIRTMDDDSNSNTMSTSFRAEEASKSRPPSVNSNQEAIITRKHEEQKEEEQKEEEQALDDESSIDDEEFVPTLPAPGAEHVPGYAPRGRQQRRIYHDDDDDRPMIPRASTRNNVVAEAELVEEAAVAVGQPMAEPTGQEFQELRAKYDNIEHRLQQQKEEEEEERKKRCYAILGVILLLVVAVGVGSALIVVLAANRDDSGADEEEGAETFGGPTFESDPPTAPSSLDPTIIPSAMPSETTPSPSHHPSLTPSFQPEPSAIPTSSPSSVPSFSPTTTSPSASPSSGPSTSETLTTSPSVSPSSSLSRSESPTTTQEGEWIRLIQSRSPSTTFNDDQASPQRLALEWMLSDTYTLSLDNDDRVVQRFALATFFFSTEGPTAWDHGGWLKPTFECNWGLVPEDNGRDISCDSQGFVQQLSLANDTLAGTIPEEVGLFSNTITHFSLPMNDLVGTIPQALTTLTALTHLSLQNNMLIGTLPTAITQLTALTWVGLWDNGLSGTIPGDFAQKLTNLEILYMQLNALSGPLPSNLESLTRLEDLLIYGNDVTGSIPSSLCVSVDRMIVDCDQVACDCCLGSRPGLGTAPCD